MMLATAWLTMRERPSGASSVATRMTIEIDDEVAERLRARVPLRMLTQFINEAIAEKLAAVERAEARAARFEGYKRRGAEGSEQERDALDVTGYPEHGAEHIRTLGRSPGEQDREGP